MSGYLWLISEMLLLLILAAVVFFFMGWSWQAKRARVQRQALEQRVDEEAQAAKVAREERDAALHIAPAPASADPEIAALAAELSETQALQLSLERELLRLRDAKLALERELEAARSTPAPAAAPDDLTLLRGVGAVMIRKLHTAGISSFRQLALLTAEELAALDRTLKLQGRAIRENWQEQARALHEKVHGTPL